MALFLSKALTSSPSMALHFYETITWFLSMVSFLDETTT